MDTLFKITAILGALAWLTQIIKWMANWNRKPTPKIIGDDEAQVGYIAFSSALNVNLSFISQHKSSLIEDMDLEIRDENNSTYKLKWAWYGETYIKFAKLIIEKFYFKNESKIEDNLLWASPAIIKQE